MEEIPMNNLNFPAEERLLPFAERLDKTYYAEIGSLCDNTKDLAQKLQTLEVQHVTSSYLSVCVELTNEVRNYLEVKRTDFIPYVRSLFRKSDSGHDCANCADGGSCGVQHQLQYTGLTRAHQQLKNILSRLQMASLPLHADTVHADLYEELRGSMARLENRVGELFLLEEAYLIPKVAEAQRNINVRA